MTVLPYFGSQVSLIPLVEDGHVTPDDSAVGVEYISDLESVCLAMRNGDVLLCNTHTHQVSTYIYQITSLVLRHSRPSICCLQYYAGEGLVKLVTCNDVLWTLGGHVEEWHIPRKTASE